MKAGGVDVSVERMLFLIRFWVQLLEIMLALCVFIQQAECRQTVAAYSCADDSMNTVIVQRENKRRMIQDENNLNLTQKVDLATFKTIRCSVVRDTKTHADENRA